MNTALFREVYRQANGISLKDGPALSLSDFLHGYLTVYSMVRVYPWLEDRLESTWRIHERVREIASLISGLLQDPNIPTATRAGHAVDLMDAYILYSDIDFLDTALHAAYNILLPQESDSIVLPDHSANTCRLLCNCYYFTNEPETGELADGLITEALDRSSRFTPAELADWWKAFQVYENVRGETGTPLTHEYFRNARLRLEARAEHLKNEKIETFRHSGHNADTCLLAEVFAILAEREFVIHEGR